ncbi:MULTISPECIES: DNA-3-methyladenine glycosylase [Olivibacter]|uniref:Putative 3-methyladenine DNA glycosylase n=1 Tax=Olivibacter jilunii TaxID=985016 RepID=A0ABW6B1F1_9SPHI
MKNNKQLPKYFYLQDDVQWVAQQLLGKVIYTSINGLVTGGIIVETEAYNGITDKASHAYGRRFTERTKVMYGEGGVSYVYLCYGIHYLFNVVTGPIDVPQAVLVRGIEPIVGLDYMLKRRNMEVLTPRLSAGPGTLTQALGIAGNFNGKSLSGDDIWIEDVGISLDEQDIVVSTRIGVEYAKEDALLPWRYYIKGNRFVSRK